MALLTSTRPKPAISLIPLLATLAAVGWGAALYTGSSLRAVNDQVSLLEIERDTLVAEQGRIKATVGELTDVQAKLASMRDELSGMTSERDKAKAQLANAQTQLATLAKRLDQARDGAAVTGSIGKAKPGKKRR